MRIGVIGINHKLADLKLRETLARACERRFGAAQSIHGFHNFLLLSTCNRTEVYFSSDDLAETHIYVLNILRQEVDEAFEHKLYSYFGVDCFYHLTCVAAGLDSAIVAETEIQGQVRIAYESAKTVRLPSELHFLFQKALKISKEVRSELITCRGIPEIEHAIMHTGLHLFRSLKGKTILFIGASEINQKILTFFKLKKVEGLTICNRSSEKAHRLAAQYDLSTLPWDQLTNWSRFDWIILGTKAPNYLIQGEDLDKDIQNQKLIIDLSFPRNVDPKIAKDPKVTLLNIDQINRMLKFRRRWLNHTLSKASEMISDAAKYQIEIYSHKEKQKSLFAIGA